MKLNFYSTKDYENKPRLRGNSFFYGVGQDVYGSGWQSNPALRDSGDRANTCLARKNTLRLVKGVVSVDVVCGQDTPGFKLGFGKAGKAY